MRDTYTDARTGWIRNGNWYDRYPSGTGPSPLGAIENKCSIPEGALAALAPDDRTIILEETAADAKFCAGVAGLISQGKLAAVVSSAKAAIANELDPRVASGTAGRWPLLRARVRELLGSIPSAISAKVNRMTTGEKMAVVQAMLRRSGGVSGLGEEPLNTKIDTTTTPTDWGITSALISSLANAAAGAYTTRVVTSAQKDITEMQSSAAMQTAQAQIALANAQAAISAAQRVQSPVTALRTAMTASVGGVPVVAIAVPGIALILYMIFRKRR